MNFSPKKIFFLLLSISIIAVACSEDDSLDPVSESNDGSGNGDGGGVVTQVLGCMVDTACNFNSAATEDDLTCDYSCYGCTESTAYNYDDNATIDDDSCEYASEIMQDTWNLDSDCDGVLATFVVPTEVTVEAGENPGDLIINLGLDFILTGSITDNGIIVVPGQDPNQFVTVSGAGSLISNTEASVYLTITTLLGSENCTITFTL